MTIVTIDRSRPFNPAEFIGPGWTTEEQDEGSLLLTEIDLTKVRLETCLNSGEQYIKGEEKLRRLKLATSASTPRSSRPYGRTKSSFPSRGRRRKTVARRPSSLLARSF